MFGFWLSDFSKCIEDVLPRFGEWPEENELLLSPIDAYQNSILLKREEAAPRDRSQRILHSYCPCGCRRAPSFFAGSRKPKKRRKGPPWKLPEVRSHIRKAVSAPRALGATGEVLGVVLPIASWGRLQHFTAYGIFVHLLAASTKLVPGLGPP